MKGDQDALLIRAQVRFREAGRRSICNLSVGTDPDRSIEQGAQFITELIEGRSDTKL